MKRIFCLFACFATLIAYAQRGGYNETVREGPFVENDTTFIQKVYHTGPNKYDNYTDKLYIETDHESEAYRSVLYQSIEFDDLVQVLAFVPGILQEYDTLAKIDNEDWFLIGEYLPLFRYQGKYYLYGPTQIGCDGRRMITQSFVLYNYLDGLYPYGITHFGKISSDAFSLSTYDAAYKGRTDMRIYVIDRDKGLIVWREREGGRNRDQLYVKVRYADAYDMIVWKTLECQPEFDGFDEIDYESIIRHKRLF